MIYHRNPLLQNKLPEKNYNKEIISIFSIYCEQITDVNSYSQNKKI